MPPKKKIKTPEILYKHFENYKKACKDSAKKENFWSSKLNKQVSVDREIPYTWIGFEIWLRKNKIIARLQDYEDNTKGNYSAYSSIIRAIKTEIYEDKFTGAVAGIFQHNIIARDLGLRDRHEHDIKDDRKLKELELEKQADEIADRIEKKLKEAKDE